MSLLSPLRLWRALSFSSPRSTSSARMQRIFRGDAALARRRSMLYWGMAGLLVILAVWPSPGRSEPETPPPSAHYSQSACFDLVGETGRMIAWARWEGRLSRDKALTVNFEEGTPDWIVTRVQDWIVDAYHWKATDEQVRQWAVELGSTQYLPRASQLTAHETIAIWLRRIARGCGPDDVAGASERI